jgi:glycosyltransferase involved in cell wall biosynthesis
MRILQVCSARTLGGGERHVADLSNSLAERGHEVYVAVAPSSPLKAKLTKVAAQNVLELRMRNAFDVPSALRLARFIREQKIDVVHAHLARDYPLASLAVRRCAQLIVTRHVMFPLDRWHRLTLARVARVIAVSEAVARALRSRKICDARKLQVIPNGINLKRFERVLSESERAGVREKVGSDVHGRRLLVGTVGSLLPLKGHEEFVRAAALAASGRDDVDFVIIGGSETGEREYRTRLERLIEQLNLQSRVRLMNWPDELAPFYKALDVYVSASHTEAFGLSIVEAMAAGLAVVATATEGAQEIIKHKETGLLVPVKDAEKLAEAIIALLENAEQRKVLGARAREDARRFSLERMVESVERVYMDAMPFG